MEGSGAGSAEIITDLDGLTDPEHCLKYGLTDSLLYTRKNMYFAFAAPVQ
jgi:hypothetical protein